MKIIRKKSWQLNENLVTSKELFEKRRSFIKLGAATLVSSGAIMELFANEKLPTETLNYIKDKNINNLKLNTYEQITSHNNFYEFTTKQSAVKDMAHTLKTENWKCGQHVFRQIRPPVQGSQVRATLVSPPLSLVARSRQNSPIWKEFSYSPPMLTFGPMLETFYGRDLRIFVILSRLGSGLTHKQ